MNDNLLVEKGMPLHSDLALTNFVRINPQMEGAGWADCLDALVDSDSNLTLTEPVYDRLSDVGIHPSRMSLINPIVQTLYYSRLSNRISPAMVHEWVNALSIMREFFDRTDSD